MILNRTVLVLGAGASAPYKFPLGATLLTQVCTGIKKKEPLWEALENCGFQENDLLAFAKELDRSMQPSVDAFLEHRPEFLEVGKAAIAAILVPHENETQLLRGASVRHWYEYLFQLLGAGREQFSKNQLSVITFNYDRSLEQFLLVALKASYGLDDEEAAELVRDMPIVHVHGCLGALPQLSMAGQKVRSYSPELDTTIIKACASEIRVVHESADGEPQFVRARKLLQQAERICFLGFGYHPPNLQRLRLGDLPDGQKVFGTGYKLKHGEQAQKKKLFPPAIHPQESYIYMGNQAHDILDFIRDVPVFV